MALGRDGVHKSQIGLRGAAHRGLVLQVRLHNGLAVCQMRMGRWEEAEAELLQVRRRVCAAVQGMCMSRPQGPIHMYA